MTEANIIKHGLSWAGWWTSTDPDEYCVWLRPLFSFHKREKGGSGPFADHSMQTLTLLNVWRRHLRNGERDKQATGFRWRLCIRIVRRWS